MKRMIYLALVAIMGVTMTSCLSVNMDSGYDKTPTLVPLGLKGMDVVVDRFNEVSIENAFKVIYQQGENYSVRVEASDQAIQEMTVYVKEGELRIRKAVKKTSPTVSFADVKVYVTSPVLSSIEIAGSGVFTASNRIEGSGGLDVEIAGSGQVLLADYSGSKADLEVAGSGTIEIGNLECPTAKAEIAGSGDINLGSMTCHEFDIEIAGSGNVNCDNITADEVHSEIAGSGNVNLKGVVKKHTEDIAGSGKVTIE